MIWDVVKWIQQKYLNNNQFEDHMKFNNYVFMNSFIEIKLNRIYSNRAKNKSFLVLISMLIFIGLSTAQNISTPEVFSFKQEVFRPISFYTGQANISIPLYEIETNEISIPISLNYIGGEGLRAINTFSNVGFGWRLTAGGAITRSVNGKPDEYVSSGAAFDLDGFFRIPANTISNEDVRNDVNSFIGYFEGAQYLDSEYELSPDLFSFSFLGYSGYFVMGYDIAYFIYNKIKYINKWISY